MLTRRIAVALVAKLQAQLAATENPGESRKKLRASHMAARKTIAENEELIVVLKTKLQREAHTLDLQRKLIRLAKEMMDEETRVMFEIKSEEMANG